MPWDEVTIAWGPVVSLIIEVLKRVIHLDERGIKWATWILGFVGMLLYRLTSGMSLTNALINAVVALLSAPGFYELITKPATKAALKK